MSLRFTSVTPKSLAARRSNALKSTGPRTLEGRRRAAFNRLRLPLEYWMRRDLERSGRSLAELRRLWHDLLAIFWFVDPGERYYGIYGAAWHWWMKLDALKKLDALRRENPSGRLPEARLLDASIENASIEDWLDRLLSRFAEGDLHWQQCIRAEFGPGALRGIKALRIAVEARLESFGARQGRRDAAEMGKNMIPRFFVRPFGTGTHASI